MEALKNIPDSKINPKIFNQDRDGTLFSDLLGTQHIFGRIDLNTGRLEHVRKSDHA